MLWQFVRVDLMGEINMTLRECSQNYIDTFVNAWNHGTVRQMSEYSSNNYNVLFSPIAREYILEKLSQTLTEYEFFINYDEEGNVYYLYKERKPVTKTPISALTWDEEFTWDKVSCC